MFHRTAFTLAIFWLGLLTGSACAAGQDDLESVRNAAVAAHEASHWADSLRLHDDYLTLAPNDANAHHRRARALRELGRGEEALAGYRRVVALEPANAYAWNGLCWTQILLGRPQEAQPACQKAVDDEPLSMGNTVNLGHTYLLQGDSAGAWRWYKKALPLIETEGDLKDGPIADFDIFIARGWRSVEAKQARAWFEAQGKAWIERKAPAERMLQEIFAAETAKDFPSALRLRERRLPLLLSLYGEQHPRVERARAAIDSSRIDLAGQLLEQKQYADALPHYRQILDRAELMDGPQGARTGAALSDLARTLTALGNNAEALPLAQRALVIAERNHGPEHANTGRFLLLLAAIHEAMGRYTEAGALYRRARTIPGIMGENPAGGGGSPGPTPSTSRIMKGIEILTPDGLLQAASAARQANDWPEALRRWDAYLEARPDDGVGHRDRAWTLVELGRLEDAAAGFGRAVAALPKDAFAWKGLCWTRILMNNAREARRACERAVTLDPGDIWNASDLGHAFLLQGDKASAWEWYRQALILLPPDNKAAGLLADFDTLLARGLRPAEMAEARQWLAQAVDHWNKARQLLARAGAARAAGEPAEDHYRQALPELLAALPPTHDEVRRAWLLLASHLQSLGRQPEAAYLVRQALDGAPTPLRARLMAETGHGAVQGEEALVRGIVLFAEHLKGQVPGKTVAEALDALRRTAPGKAVDILHRYWLASSQPALVEAAGWEILRLTARHPGRADSAVSPALDRLISHYKAGQPPRGWQPPSPVVLRQIVRNHRGESRSDLLLLLLEKLVDYGATAGVAKPVTRATLDLWSELLQQLTASRKRAVSLNNLAFTLFQQGYWHEAKQLFQSITAIESLGGNAWSGLGDIAYAENRYPEALHYYRRFLEEAERLKNDGAKDIALRSLGLINDAAGDKDLSISLLESARSFLEARPNAAPAALIKILWDLGSLHESEKGYGYLKRALGLAMKEASPIPAQTQTERALRYGRVAERYPGLLDALANRASKLHRDAEAAHFWQAAVMAEPDGMLGRTGAGFRGQDLAHALWRTGRHDEAKQVHQDLVDRLARNPEGEPWMIQAMEMAWSYTLATAGLAEEALARMSPLPLPKEEWSRRNHLLRLAELNEAVGRDEQATASYRQQGPSTATGSYDQFAKTAALLLRTGQWQDLNELLDEFIARTRQEADASPLAGRDGRLASLLDYAALVAERHGDSQRARKLRAEAPAAATLGPPAADVRAERPQLQAQIGQFDPWTIDVAGDLVLTNGLADPILWRRSGQRLHSVPGQFSDVTKALPSGAVLTTDGERVGLWPRGGVVPPRTIAAHPSLFKLVLSPMRKRLATTDGLVVRLWEAATLVPQTTIVLPRFIGQDSLIWLGEEQLAAANFDIGVIVRIDADGNTIERRAPGVLTLRPIPGSRRFLAWYQDHRVEIWDAATLAPVRHLPLPQGIEIASVASDGKGIAVQLWGSENELLWWPSSDHDKPEQRRLLPGTALVATADAAYLARADQGGQTLSIDPIAPNAPRVAALRAVSQPVSGLSFSLDGHRLFVRSDESLATWNLKDGNRVPATIQDARGQVRNQAALETVPRSDIRIAGYGLSPEFDDQGDLLTGRAVSQDGITAYELVYWPNSGIEQHWSSVQPGMLDSLRISTADRAVFASQYPPADRPGAAYQLLRFALADGKPDVLYEGASPFRFELLPGGKALMIWPFVPERQAELIRFDLATGARTTLPCRLPVALDQIQAIQFAADGKRFAAQMATGFVALDLDEPERPTVVATTPSHFSLSSDGTKLAVAESGGTIALYDTQTGRRSLTLMSMRDGGWAAVDEDGRFDGANGGDVDGLHWVVGLTPIALSQLKERYYEPGLIAKTLGYSTDPLRPVAQFEAPHLFPKVELTAEPDRVRVKLSDQGGGIGKVRVLVNGKEIQADARGTSVAPSAREATIPIELAELPLIPGQDNTVEVVAWNAEGYLSSRGIRTIRGREPTASDLAPPTLHAIVAGVSTYANPAMNLVFPGKDASDIAAALRLAGKRLFGVERVNVHLLTDAPGTDALPPSRENLGRAFAEVAARAQPSDLLVVYLAGHGVMSPGDGSDYHYLTREARATDLGDPAVRRSYGVSSAELTEWIKAIPALKQVMVLDTCAAGGAVEKLTQARALSSDQIRALDRLKDRTGFHVLMGAAADKVSYESSQYGQGLLTYAILQGMKGAALREGEYVDVQTLFQHAADQVPQLAQSIGGVQKPVIAAPRGASFDIGQLKSEDKPMIPLASRRPMMLRAAFQDERRPIDPVGLSKAVNRSLREEAAHPARSRFVFVDSDELPGAYQLAGRYRRQGDEVTVAATVYLGDDEVANFNATGSIKNKGELVRQLLELGIKAIIDSDQQKKPGIPPVLTTSP